MKFTTAKSDLKAAVAAVMPAVSPKPMTPAMGGLCFTTIDGRLQIRATGAELDITATIPADIEKKGEIVIPAHIISSITPKLGGEIATLTGEGANATIKSEAAKFDLNLIADEYFPRRDEHDFTAKFAIRGRVLKQVINRSMFAIFKMTSNLPFSGVCFEVNEDGLQIISTNTHRISIQHAEIIDTPAKYFVVPAPALKAVNSILSDKTSNLVHVSVSDNHASFGYGNLEIVTRLLEGAFPPVDQLIPKEPVTFATVNVAELQAALTRVDIIASRSEFHTCAMAFTREGLTVSANSSFIGEMEEHVDADVEGDDMEISFNIDYLTDYLNVLRGDKTEQVKFDLTDPLVPAVCRGVGVDDFIYIVTPVRPRT